MRKHTKAGFALLMAGMMMAGSVTSALAATDATAATSGVIDTTKKTEVTGPGSTAASTETTSDGHTFSTEAPGSTTTETSGASQAENVQTTAPESTSASEASQDVTSGQASVANGMFSSEGITVLLALIGVLITGVLLVKGVKGNILWGILITWALGIVCQLTGLYQINPEAGFYSLLPDFSNGISIPSLAPTFMKMDFSRVASLDFLVVMFAFLFVDMFDTLGTLIGVASKANMLDEQGRLPRIRGALLSDSVGTAVGAVLGTSTTTTFVESASGVAEGGRTGLTAVVAAILFGLSLFLSPIFLAIPSFATAPALIVVGFLMLTSILKVNFEDYTEAIPAYVAVIAMPFMYSISEGIAMGIISYVVINLVTGKAKEKHITPLMYVLAVLFVLKYILL